MLGKLSWAAIPFDQPIPLVAAAVVGVVIIGVLAWVTLKGWLPYLWREWITSVDHKRIGIMYILLAMVMLLRGFADAIMMRSQQALAFQSEGYLPPEHYDQIFSAHGTLMIFFVAMPFVIGLMNFVMPLQLGIRDVAFPTLNSVSFWLTATGALLVNISLVVGEFARTGWLPYPPLSELTYSPGVGVDYYLWSLQISGVGTLLTGVNFVTTVLKIHAPGMTYMRMPMFCWTTLASNLLIVAAFPILTATLAMLLLDRYLGFHFFTNEAGGNVMMFMNLIWAWGHPEVYILILPAFGVFSEVISTFSGKPLFGYRSMVMATMAICVLSFTVWLHHFFTMGAGADVNAIFGIASMIIAVPTGVKVFNWLFTMYGGRVVYSTPMLWSIGFMVTFVDRRHDRRPAGGAPGGLRAAQQPFPRRPLPQRHHRRRAVRRVRRLHLLVSESVRLPAARRPWQGVVLVLDHRLLRRLHAALCPRPDGNDASHAALRCPRMASVAADRGRRRGHHPGRNNPADRATRRQHSPARRASRRDRRSLERALPRMGDILSAAGLQLRGAPARRGRGRLLAHEAAASSQQARPGDEPAYTEIEMPRNSPTGFICAFFATFMGFALIWHIWWIVALAALGAYATFVVFAWRDDVEYVIPADAVARIDRANRSARGEALRPIGGGIMSAFDATAGHAVPRRVGRDQGSPGPHHRVAHRRMRCLFKRIVVGYGFWIFLLSDIVMFSAFFATYAVLVGATAGGPSGQELFNLRQGRARDGLPSPLELHLRPRKHRRPHASSDPGSMARMAATFILGAAFLTIEIREFAGMVALGAGPTRSAFLSAFFTLVGCHGLHVTIGLLWLLTMMAQVFAKGYRADILRRMLCFSLFWHALDIIWVALFTVVYLMGVAQ